MTTLVGILALKGTPAVVLASDLTGTRTEWESEGDIAVRTQTKKEVKKIHVNESRTLAISMAGISDDRYSDFLLDLKEGKINFYEVLKKRDSNLAPFEALRDLNLGRMNGKTYQQNLQNGFLVATRYDDTPLLWTCFPLGRVENRFWTAVGSGEKHASKHIQEQGYSSPREICLETAITLASNALREASADIYTGGWDVAVVTPSEIIEYGPKIKENLQRCEQKTLREIITNSKQHIPLSQEYII